MVIWTEGEVITSIDLYTNDVKALIDTIITLNEKYGRKQYNADEIYTEWLIDPSILLHSRFEGWNIQRPMVESDVEKVCNWLKEHITFDQDKHVTFDRIDFEYVSLSDYTGTVFECATFKNCIINNSIFGKVYFVGAHFINTCIMDSRFINCNFLDAEFKDCESLYGSRFYDCEFRNTINPPHISLACPSEGGFIGWKKAKTIKSKNPASDDVLIKLYIPADAKRSSATGNKCRCSKAKVLDITSIDGWEHYDKACSFFDPNFEYEVGKYIFSNGFNTDRFIGCSSGIHFFIDKQDAIDY